MPSHNIALSDREILVRVRRSAAARRMSLRVDPASETVLLVLPQGVAVVEGLGFVRAKNEWILARLAALPPRRVFADGAMLPLFGQDHRICHTPEARRGVWVENGIIHVSGRIEYLPRRLGDWLKREAHRTLADRAHRFAQCLEHPCGRISVRDSRSRWGSCSARGDLSFSWRLVFAPAAVADYVAAHEVAHLIELNHSPAFWRVGARLVDNVAEARIWLRRNGPMLHRYG
ncbi:MAG: M48 family metallopeptidase [Alphaproteobacteria bacterium]|nr:M48 family metallopeptidase [Alphaproteobacteria bacterium]